MAVFYFRLSGLYQSSFEEGSVGAVLLHRAHALGRNFDSYGFVYFRHKNSLLLDIKVFSDFAGRVEFSRTGSVRVAAAHN